MYTVKQVAQELHLSYNTVKSYIRKGYIKATKLGRDWVIEESELTRLKEKYKEKVTEV